MALQAPLLQNGGEGPELDCLIVGAGPVGLLATAEMAARGCKVRLIDVNAAPVQLTKASGVAERSMEILPQPVSESILSTSKHVKQARLFEKGEAAEATVIAELRMERNMRGGKGLRSQMQWLTEKAITQHLETIPDLVRPGSKMRVERPLELVNFEQNERSVECEIRNASTGESERISSKFLLGCDGGRSSIRKGLGFTFKGEVTDEYFFAIHAKFNGYVGRDDCVDMYFSKGSDPLAPGFTFAMPMPDDGYLIIVDLDTTQQKDWVTSEMDRNGLPILREPTPEDVCKILKARGCGKDLEYEPGSVKWVACFRVNSRQTNHYGKGRVYLAGDALHCHSPLGGQGMNMGFNDAKNIAWKLAFCAKGASMRLLDSYELERLPVEHKILKAIERGQAAVSSRNPVVFFMRGRGQRLAPVLLNFQLDHTDGQLLRYGTQQAWTYDTSPLAQEHWERPGLSSLSGALARKDQNLLRWIGSRLRGGDSVPDGRAEGTTVHTVLKRAKGFTLVLFEGSKEENDRQSRFIANVQIRNCKELQALGDSLKTAPDASGFVAGIDEVLVVPAGDEAQTNFGVRGQCLYLIRPDMHVALRCEPVREGAVLRYMDKQCGIKVKAYSCPDSSKSFDALPVTAHGTIFTILLLIAGSKRFSVLGWNIALGFWFCLVAFILKMSVPPSSTFNPSSD